MNFLTTKYTKGNEIHENLKREHETHEIHEQKTADERGWTQIFNREKGGRKMKLD